MADTIILGTVAGELLNQVLETKDKAINFKSELQRLQNTLEQVIPLFNGDMQLDLVLNDRKRKLVEDLIEKLQKGKGLIQNCSKVLSWDFYHKILYSRKIIDLDEAIVRFCQLELQEFQVEIWRDNKQLLLDVRHVLSKVEGNMEGLDVQQGRTVVGVPVGSNEGLFSVPEVPDLVVGFDKPLEELKIGLFRENVTVVGLCGPRGYGKTTLAAMVCHDKKVRGTFKDKILFITVSKMDALEILQRLLEAIGGGMPRSDLSEEEATKQLQYLLKQRKSEPLLLVLDDVSDESIIEKLFSRTEGYKMLVTSREAFKIFNLKYHSKYLLDTLSHQDSVTLLRHTALSHDGNESYGPNEDHLNEIVRCCNGFPLAIIVIAKLLSRQPAMMWENMARRLSEGSSIRDNDEKLRECLAISLDFLDDTLLECFLDLGSFPEDERIPASALIDIWCELFELENEDDAYVNLLELASRNLVNLVGSRKVEKEIDASFNELFVTQDHLLRDLAIYQSRPQGKRLIMDKREKGLPESWREQENHYLTARLVSLNTGEMCSESWYELQLLEVEVLILNFSASNYVLPSFMGKMRKLKVLIVANHGRTHAKMSNLKTLGELANLKRIRLEKVSIHSLHEFTMPLKNLQKISLVRCEIGQALIQCTINVSNMLPNLVDINIDYCDDLKELPPWICDMSYLRTLSITNCYNLSALPEGIGYITDLELLRLHACIGLSKLPDLTQGLQKLTLLDISDCSNLEMLPDWMCELHCLKKLDMRGCIKLRGLPPSVMNLVQLKEVICDEDIASL